MAMSATSSLKRSPRATKSVSQLTSTNTPSLHDAASRHVTSRHVTSRHVTSRNPVCGLSGVHPDSYLSRKQGCGSIEPSRYLKKLRNVDMHGLT